MGNTEKPLPRIESSGTSPCTLYEVDALSEPIIYYALDISSFSCSLSFGIIPHPALLRVSLIPSAQTKPFLSISDNDLIQAIKMVEFDTGEAEIRVKK